MGDKRVEAIGRKALEKRDAAIKNMRGEDAKSDDSAFTQGRKGVNAGETDKPAESKTQFGAQADAPYGNAVGSAGHKMGAGQEGSGGDTNPFTGLGANATHDAHANAMRSHADAMAAHAKFAAKADLANGGNGAKED
jgi:hypothetical protein